MWQSYINKLNINIADNPVVFFFGIYCVGGATPDPSLRGGHGATSGTGLPALCGVTTPRPRQRAAPQARLTPMLHPGALLGLHYKPCEDGDFREECIIILHLYRVEEHTGELQPRGGGRAGLVVGDPLFELF